MYPKVLNGCALGDVFCNNLTFTSHNSVYVFLLRDEHLWCFWITEGTENISSEKKTRMTLIRELCCGQFSYFLTMVSLPMFSVRP